MAELVLFWFFTRHLLVTLQVTLQVTLLYTFLLFGDKTISKGDGDLRKIKSRFLRISFLSRMSMIWFSWFYYHSTLQFKVSLFIAKILDIPCWTYFDNLSAHYHFTENSFNGSRTYIGKNFTDFFFGNRSKTVKNSCFYSCRFRYFASVYNGKSLI